MILAIEFRFELSLIQSKLFPQELDLNFYDKEFEIVQAVFEETKASVSGLTEEFGGRVSVCTVHYEVGLQGDVLDGPFTIIKFVK